MSSSSGPFLCPDPASPSPIPKEAETAELGGPGAGRERGAVQLAPRPSLGLYCLNARSCWMMGGAWLPMNLRALVAATGTWLFWQQRPLPAPSPGASQPWTVVKEECQGAPGPQENPLKTLLPQSCPPRGQGHQSLAESVFVPRAGGRIPGLKCPTAILPSLQAWLCHGPRVPTP